MSSWDYIRQQLHMLISVYADCICDNLPFFPDKIKILSVYKTDILGEKLCGMDKALNCKTE